MQHKALQMNTYDISMPKVALILAVVFCASTIYLGSRNNSLKKEYSDLMYDHKLMSIKYHETKNLLDATRVCAIENEHAEWVVVKKATGETEFKFISNDELNIPTE